MKVDITLLKEHPLNNQIYGDEDPAHFADFFENIRTSGFIKPLVVNRNYTIISGHRRYKAALGLGRTEIDIEFYQGDDDKEVERLLDENAFREKTTLQKVREAEYYRQIEEKKAIERRNFIGIQNIGQSPEVVPHPPLEERGKVRDIVGLKIGLSGKVYDQARKVVERIDDEENELVKFFMEDTLNTNIGSASKLAGKPNGFVETVIEKTEGDVSKVGLVLKELAIEENKKNVHFPPGKYQVLYADMTSVPITENLFTLPMEGIAQETSVIFIWVTPTEIAKGLKLIQGWGFDYRTCIVWNKEYLKDVNNNFQLLLVGAKGNPVMLFKDPEPYRNGNKPSVIRERIKDTYLGDKVDLEFGDTLEGWKIWR